MKMQLQFVCAVLLAIASTAAPAAEWAPKRPVRMIVPFPPGGAVDTIARIVASGLPERLGQQVVVDNRGGANAIIGTELTARAVPDGHTKSCESSRLSTVDCGILSRSATRPVQH